VVSVLGGCQTVFFNAAWSATVPHLVDREHLNEANGKLISSFSLAQVSGPAVAGTLVSWLTGPVTMWIQSMTFATSGWFISRIQKPETPHDRAALETPHFWREMREGFHALVGSRVVRPLTTSAAVLNLGGSIFLAVYVLYMTNDLGLSSRGIGLVFAAGGAGSLVGSIIASPLANRLGVGRSILWGAIGFSVFSLFVPFAIFVPAIALPLVVISEAGAWGTLQVFNVNRFSLRQALTPDHLLGRVSSSSMTIIGGMQMFGALIGGVIGDVFSIHTALISGSVGMFVAVWWVWDSPIPAIRVLPDHPDDALLHVMEEAPASAAV
jgi:predicted MFS family arabinose efflux permease